MALDAWLRTAYAAPSGGRRWLDLLAKHGDVIHILNLPRAELEAAGLSRACVDKLLAPDTAILDAWRDWLSPPGRAFVALDSPAYPALLRDSPDPPVALWVAGGDLGLLNAPQIAIVGSRNPTRSGRDTAERFASYLSERGLTITSGLATGIDGAGHLGALAGGGGTIAVLGSGLDIIFPPSHTGLAERIAANGLLVSEFPPGTPPRAAHFPQRNRIIAGLSIGTLVVEAARRSGSLITARLAGEYGREVFAIPGSIHNPLAKGCHELIRQGAKLVDDAADILVELAPLLAIELERTAPVDSAEIAPLSLTEQPAYKALLEALGFDPIGFSMLVERTGLTAAELSSMLLVLEFEGLVESLPGSRYARLAERTS